MIGNIMRPLLSIYIPTYRRLPRLMELLYALQKAFDMLATEMNHPIDRMIEIVISCNDTNEEPLVRQYLDAQHPALNARVVSPYRNIGGNENILSAASQTTGEYIWIICDDDLPYRNALIQIAHIIQKHAPSVLYLEPRIVNPKRVYREYGMDTPSFLFVKKVQELFPTHYENDNVALIDDLWLSKKCECFLRTSSVVFCRSKTHNYWQSKLRHYAFIPSLRIAFDALCGGHGMWLKEPIYAYVNANPGWEERWLFINYFQSFPAVRCFLKSRNIKVPVNYKYIPAGDILGTLKSLGKGLLISPRITYINMLLQYMLQDILQFIRILFRAFNRKS